MDNSHIALVALKLEASEFDEYRCDRNMPLGVNVSLIHTPTDNLMALTHIVACLIDQNSQMC